MKTTLIVISAVAGAMLAAAANAFSLPAHEPNGYRDTGCVEAEQKPIPGTNAFSNPTCKQNLGYTSTRLVDPDGVPNSGDESYRSDN